MSIEVIGYDDYDDVEGDVLGDVLGYAGPMGDEDELDGIEVIGYDDDGSPIVLGARRGRRKSKRLMRARRKPGWRQHQLAPGVQNPGEGLLPLPLTGVGGSTFTDVITQISFEGQIQKPFRGERLLVSTVRTGASATGRLISQLFVGTDLQQLDVPGFDAEQVGDPNAFGVRLQMKAAQPGVFIRLVTTLTPGLTAPDTVFASVTLLGRYVG